MIIMGRLFPIYVHYVYMASHFLSNVEQKKSDSNRSRKKRYYQTEHLCKGLIGDPCGQLKVSANSSKFETVPTTLNCAGLWEPTCTRNFNTSGRYFPHQMLAALIQNNCFGVYLRPGNAGSGPLSRTYS